MLPKVNPTQTKAWQELQLHFEKMKFAHMKQMFQEDPKRFEKFHIDFEDLLVDFSKNIITEKTLDLLFDLARQTHVHTVIKAMFSGEKINETEDRAVLHTALRNMSGEVVFEGGRDIMPDVLEVRKKMERFCEKIINGEWKGFTGKPIQYIINIGIGGSDLGPYMAAEALKPFANHLKCYFVSNVDGTHIAETLKQIDPESSLFIIASKTFTTQETMANAHAAKNYILRYYNNDDSCVPRHFVALSTNVEKVISFGIDRDNIFEFWDWVGGRYSLSSAIGLSLALSIGYDNFEKMLQGMHAMDMHFLNEPFERNIPVILALIGIWYVNFFGAESIAILPYDQYLHRFTSYFQQADMESNGKSVDRNGEKLGYHTGPIVWGEPGTNGQHAFYQLIHQGTRLVPCDFLMAVNSHNELGKQQIYLSSNFLAQTQALMTGKTIGQAYQELKAAGLSDEDAQKLAPYREFEGNKPTNSIMFKKMTPYVLGKLIAMYEHKIFVQGIIWNIYSFDQWGVELGKQMANKIVPVLSGSSDITTDFDSSTAGLIKRWKSWRD